jgi:hypothetical protein
VKKFLQRIGVLRTPTFVFTKYDVVVYVMSEGTAQGIPRPLQVLKTTFAWELDPHEKCYTFGTPVSTYVPAERRIEDEVARIVRYGFTHTLPNRTKVLYAPQTIYKVTYEVTKDE